MKRHYLTKGLVFFSIFLMLFLSLDPSSLLKAKNNKVIRVGYPLMEGLSMKDADGNYYGYDYDYLTQVAQYTGWQYEFVEVEGTLNDRLGKLMTMLQNGEIDIMPGVKYMDALANVYDYASEPYGNGYNVIAVKNDSDIVDLASLLNKKHIRIAVWTNSSSRISLLDQFAEMNGFTYEKVICDSEEELEEKVNNKEADAILAVDLSMPSGYLSISRFSPDPFYFITTKGNTQIIQELNQAITNISQINPTLISNLHNRYFSGDTSTFIMNQTEKDYIANHSEINVLVRDGNAPVQYVINGVAMGVGKDLLDQVTLHTGMKFHYIYADSYDEYLKLANENTIDMMLGVPYEVTFADSVNANLSDPYVSGSLILVTNKDVDPSDLNNKNQATTYYNNQLYDHNTNVSYYDTLEDALQAVDQGKVDYVFVNSYLYSYYMSKYAFQNISSYTTLDYLQSQYSFGVLKQDDLTLLSILNKTIRSQESNIETFIFKNAYVDKRFHLTRFIQNHILTIVVTMTVVVLLMLYFIRRHYDNQLKMKKAIELEYMRYQMLSDISGEMTFSYDYEKDELKISTIGLGKLANEPIIKNFSIQHLDKNKYPEILHLLYSYLLEKQDMKCEQQSHLLQQTLTWYQISIKVIHDSNKGKDIAVYAIGKVYDIQKEKGEKELLLLKSQTDTLTGILNRGGAQLAISEALANEKGLGAMIMIDLDNFKNVNDDYGHIEGDLVLVETAQLLKRVFKNEIVARLGGDEFLIYVSDTNEEKLRVLCELTLKEIAAIACLQNKPITLSTSMGVVFSSYSKDFIELMQCADEKLYEVKRSGRNNYRL